MEGLPDDEFERGRGELFSQAREQLANIIAEDAHLPGRPTRLHPARRSPPRRLSLRHARARARSTRDDHLNASRLRSGRRRSLGT
ncbi:MAG: hypothetical protein ACLTSX_04075 [Collinsella sp.]